jgi:hypothetical protein
MQTGMALILLPLMLVLAVGLVSIIGAGIREAQLEPGASSDVRRRRRARIAMGTTAVGIVFVLWFGNRWWDSEAGLYQRWVFKPLDAEASLESGERLKLELRDPGWLNRQLDDFIPDHNHLMHLYAIRLPGMERVWHLHPEQIRAGTFELPLPPMPAGRYKFFADLVHASGLPETVVTEADLPAIAGRPLSGDDAGGEGPPVAQADINRTVSPLADGRRMVWLREGSVLKAKKLHWFRFEVQDAGGQPVRDLQLYMGMPGHAAFVRTDLSVFAHVHPTGSVPMAALALAGSPGDLLAVHAAHMAHGMGQATDGAGSGLPAVVSFPYGCPQAGNYRIYVQVKRGGRIETGIFDAKVEN